MIENARIQLKISSTASETPTIPTTDNHNDGSWLDTDVYVGELFFNSADGLLYIRDDSDNIINITSGGGGSELDGVVTVEVDRTFVLTDSNKLIQLDGTTDRIFTVPPNSSVAFPIGTQILVERVNTAELDIAGGSGVTINSTDGNLSLNKQYSGAVLIKTDTDTWELFGDLKA